MTDKPDNIVLRYLRRLDERTERIETDVSDITHSLASMRQHMTGFMAADAAHEGSIASIQTAAQPRGTTDANHSQTRTI